MGRTGQDGGSALGLLNERLQAATGGDSDLDQLLAEAFAAPAMAYTGSVDAALELVERALPGWHWHVGWRADGITPYVILSDAEATTRVESSAPSVPIALLRALLQARSQRPPG